MSKNVKVLSNGGFESVEDTSGLTLIQKDVVVDDNKYNIYTSGLFLNVQENTKEYDLHHLKTLFGECVDVYSEDNNTLLKDTLSSSSMLLVVFKDSNTFLDVTYEEEIVKSNSSTISYDGTYYYDLHEGQLKLLTSLPVGYIIDSNKNKQDAPCIYNPSNTTTCGVCGDTCISESTCGCRDKAKVIWDSDNRGLNSYNYTPDFSIRGTQRTGVTTIGVELEMVAPSKEVHPNMSDTFKNDEFLYLMSDGSLPSLGVEMASHPFTYEWFKTQNDPLRLKYLRKLGMITKDESRAGMHFHIDKKSFKDDDHFDAWYRLLTSNLQYLEKLCGRTCGGYNEACNYPSNSKKKLDDDTSRTSLISNRGKTIEFRMFKSDIDKVEFAIEFLVATIDYSKTVKTNVGWTRFKKYLNKNLSKYPNLKTTFIDKKVPKGLFRVFESDTDWLSDFD